MQKVNKKLIILASVALFGAGWASIGQAQDNTGGGLSNAQLGNISRESGEAEHSQEVAASHAATSATKQTPAVKAAAAPVVAPKAAAPVVAPKAPAPAPKAPPAPKAAPPKK